MGYYAIWDKKTPIITPIGEVLTPQQWMDRYPVAKLPNITVLCSAGEINGGFFGTLGQLIQQYKNKGADFSLCKTDEDKLKVIEDFDLAAKNAADNTPSPEERIAAALEYQMMTTMPDVTE